MEPFATKPKRQFQLHWWIVGGVAAAFVVWQLDLIPRVRKAATGSVARTDQKSSPEVDTFLDGDWSDIHDTSTDSEDTLSGMDHSDPLSHALARDRKDIRPASDGVTNSPQRQMPNSSRRDSQVTRASYEPDAPLEENGLELRADLYEPEDPALRQKPPAVLSAEVAQRLREIEEDLNADQILEAHQAMSDIYWKHPEYRSLIQKQIDQTAALIFTTAERQFADPHFVDYGETLGSIAKKYDVPWQYLARLNQVNPEDLQAGQQLKVVRGPFGAVIDLDDFCLTVHAHGWYVHRYPVGIGADNGTPVGKFKVEEKLENPTWYNPDGGVVDGDDPENPLGEYWLGLGNHIGIHGTINPESIGKAVSRGCIHLDDQDIEEVFGLLTVGSQITIRK